MADCIEDLAGQIKSEFKKKRKKTRKTSKLKQRRSGKNAAK